MKNQAKSLLALLLAGLTLVGLTGCKDKEEEIEESAFDYPEKYITVPELSTIELSRAELDKQLQAEIDTIIENNSYEDFQAVTDASRMGDEVIISFTGRAADENVTLSDASLNGMSADKTDYIIGSNYFVDAYYDKDGNMLTDSFDNQLIGINPGETKEIEVTFSDTYPYSEEVRGVKVILTVTVHSITRVTANEKSKLTLRYFFEQPEDDTNTAEDFAKLFKDGRAIYDPMAEGADSVTFGTIFKIADIADVFIGRTKYDEIRTTLTIPEDADEAYEAYRGKEIVAIFIPYYVTTVPEWNDEFVKKYSGGTYTNVADYEAMMMNGIIGEKAFVAIVGVTQVIEYPEAETDAEYRKNIAELIAQETGQSVEGMSEKEMLALLDDQTYKNVCVTAGAYAYEEIKARLLQEYLVKTLNVKLTEEEYQKELEAAYRSYCGNAGYFETSYGIRIESAAEMESLYGREMLELQFELNRVRKLLPDIVTIVD